MPPKVFDDKLSDAIANSKILVVGAGGIGCEVLKNLVLTGFRTIEIIDLDTIDVSNLNRQFLFRKEHVGKSKAEVAKESALGFNPNVNIIAHHNSVISKDYNVTYLKQFTLVLNALDNRVARNHMNRLCLAANIPLVETGTAGYAGQVEIIKKGIVQCYECQPQKSHTSYPSCTIRNTPSEPIHCIVWAKHLFNQMFGDEDPDQAVSPDTEDPANSQATNNESPNNKSSLNGGGNITRKSTREWANETNYDPEKMFKKLFVDDVLYLLNMHDLWKDRRPPVPLSDKMIAKGAFIGGTEKGPMSTHKPRTCLENVQVFANSVKALHKQLVAGGTNLEWDKDDKHSMDFVAACANLRCRIFHLQEHNQFQIKSMAGNIIPAIATANAIVAGAAVLKVLAILREELPDAAAAVFMRAKVNHNGYLLVPEKVPTPPNPKCAVCSLKPEISLSCNLNTLTLQELNTAFLQGLDMTAADAVVEGLATVILSSEPGETDDMNDKCLKSLGVQDGTALIVEDYNQNYEVRVKMIHNEDETSWRIIKQEDDIAKVPSPEKTAVKAGPSNRREDDDVQIVYDRVPAKRRRLSSSL